METITEYDRLKNQRAAIERRQGPMAYEAGFRAGQEWAYGRAAALARGTDLALAQCIQNHPLEDAPALVKPAAP